MASRDLLPADADVTAPPANSEAADANNSATQAAAEEERQRAAELVELRRAAIERRMRRESEQGLMRILNRQAIAEQQHMMRHQTSQALGMIMEERRRALRMEERNRKISNIAAETQTVEDNPARDTAAAAAASSTGSAVLTMEHATKPWEQVSAAEIPHPELEPPAFWMVGEGTSPNAWWHDCSKPFADVLEAQMAAGVPVACYVFNGDLAAGPVSFVHDLRDMTQLNQNTGQRKHLRRLREINAAARPTHPHHSSGSCPPVPAGLVAGAAGACAIVCKLAWVILHFVYQFCSRDANNISEQAVTKNVQYTLKERL